MKSKQEQEMLKKFKECIEYFQGKCPSDFNPEVNECGNDCTVCWYKAFQDGKLIEND